MYTLILAQAHGQSNGYVDLDMYIDNNTFINFAIKLLQDLFKVKFCLM
jgi:hypothetical protein